MKLLKMQLYYTALVFVINIYVCSSGKEIEAHGSYIINNLNLQRQKRTRNGYNEHDSESRNNERSSACSPKKPTPELNTIIKSSASIANGAKYLYAKNGTSSLECFNMCCQDPACDTSIYEDKGIRRCYLFHCHGLCKFKEHSNYFVWDIDRQVLTPPPKEEEELAHLHNKVGISDENNDEHRNDDDDNDEHRSGSKSSSDEDISNSRTNDGTDPSKMGTPTYTHKSETAYVAPHTAGLSNYCDSDVSCEDPNAGCFGQACHCKKDFYNKNGLCRKMCSQSDFECLTLGTSGRGPECIPKSKMCDSYMQCADGSDELDCGNQDEQSGHRVPSSGIIKNKGTYPPGLKASTDEIHSGIQKSKSTSSSDTQGTDTKASSVLIPKTGKNAPTSSHDSSSAENVKNKPKQSIDTGGSGSSSKTNVTHSSTTKKPHSIVKENSNSKVFVTQEKVIIASSTSEAEGPIIALSLGLAFTLILIGLLGCRLRNMKHRLRKGRPLNSNEADYLINGMYL